MLDKGKYELRFLGIIVLVNIFHLFETIIRREGR
jgi:hypothetical protein